MGINSLFNTFETAIVGLKQHLPISAGLIGLLFVIHILNRILGYRLNILGIWPRKKFGWIGIPFSPFLHGNFTHLIFNALPLFIFSNFILLQGLSIFITASIVIVLLSGLLVFVFGRSGIHIGASSLIMGYLGFIVVGIYYHPNALSIVIGLTCIIYFSGMFINIFPSSDKQVSWEGHFLGLLSGIATAYLMPYLMTTTF
ncbi:MAG: rhomboid family intramembrane serine protease [Gammaproteobacteria bacterium CG_4_10_14_0_8_um_filter_38_16]|nr:MAG: rhomboid family intramembrane serine protease [Gammaproteobacteria bacterium CG_4_10_14_0_8_um_filter_38_16]PJA03426.1 MAG: rhomboid family intramembrane serine protease [Gammaproteobacteria bacterium CG_4_10_14_0_2_um_filter_38_22]PJB10581.1 MAG: rhomboid family intramembrane serine protease [Gammaproteobacteria bacterium CG_4_9_14_3_um_filter_38_9]